MRKKLLLATHICIYLALTLVRISDFPNGRIVVITFMEPPSFVGSMCPEIRPSLPKYLHALRPGLSPNITLHIPTLINRKKESKHHGGRNRRQKVSLNRVGHASSKENLHRIFFLTWPPRVRVQQQIFMNFILFSGVFSNTVQ